MILVFVAFRIPMRGNEATLRFLSSSPVMRVFRIPMRGNEDPLGGRRDGHARVVSNPP